MYIAGMPIKMKLYKIYVSTEPRIHTFKQSCLKSIPERIVKCKWSVHIKFQANTHINETVKPVCNGHPKGDTFRNLRQMAA